MKKIFNVAIKILTILTLTSCSFTNSSEEVSFNTSAESFLVEGVDYIDHANTFDGYEFEYDQSMWYINNLHDVPLPDPHVFYEDGKYYINETEIDKTRYEFTKSSCTVSYTSSSYIEPEFTSIIVEELESITSCPSAP